MAMARLCVAPLPVTTLKVAAVSLYYLILLNCLFFMLRVRGLLMVIEFVYKVTVAVESLRYPAHDLLVVVTLSSVVSWIPWILLV